MNIGDKVRVVKKIGGIQAGEVGKITADHDNVPYRYGVMLDKHGYINFSEDEIELVPEIGVGDLIEYSFKGYEDHPVTGRVWCDEHGSLRLGPNFIQGAARVIEKHEPYFTNADRAPVNGDIIVLDGRAGYWIRNDDTWNGINNELTDFTPNTYKLMYDCKENKWL